MSPPQYENALLRGYVECCSNLTWCTNPQGCDQILCKENMGSMGTCSKCCWASCFSCNFPEVRGHTSVSASQKRINDQNQFIWVIWSKTSERRAPQTCANISQVLWDKRLCQRGGRPGPRAVRKKKLLLLVLVVHSFCQKGGQPTHFPDASVMQSRLTLAG